MPARMLGVEMDMFNQMKVRSVMMQIRLMTMLAKMIAVFHP
jgi:hypothetical protein